MPVNHDGIKEQEEWPGQYDGMINEYDGPPVGFDKPLNPKYHSVPSCFKPSVPISEDPDYVRIGPGRYRYIGQKRNNASVRTTEEVKDD